MHTLNHLLHSHKLELVAKVNYNMFQSEPFRLWRSHATATKDNDGRNHTCIRKLKQVKAAVSAADAQNFIYVSRKTICIVIYNTEIIYATWLFISQR